MRVRFVKAASFAAFLMLATTIRAHAQDTTSTANLKLTPVGQITQLVFRDGSTLNGQVVEVTPTTVRFVSSIGETTIPRITIAKVRQVDPTSVHDGQVWPEDPSRTRLFFAPTGRMLKTSETYFTDAYIFFPSVQVGLSDQLSIGGGMSIFPGLAIDEQFFYLTPKLGVYASPNVNVAVGALVGGEKEISDQSPIGIGYGVATFGDENTNATIGSGFGFSRGNTSSTALVMLGGSTRVSKSLALVTENYFLTNGDANFLASGGVRFMSEHIAVDLALFSSKGVTPALVPYVAFIYRW